MQPSPPREDKADLPPEEQYMGTTRLARRVFTAFIVTFALARSVALLMSLGFMKDFYFRFGQTHVHHLNYGIFLLTGVGAYLIFMRPDGRGLSRAAGLYGIGLALTFDEFGMWLHLDDVYWQRASFDAMVLIAGILGVIMVAPTVRRFHLRHWIWSSVLLLAVALFTMLLMQPLQRFHQRIRPLFQQGRPPATDPAAPADSFPSGGSVRPQPPAGPSQRIRK